MTTASEMEEEDLHCGRETTVALEIFIGRRCGFRSQVYHYAVHEQAGQSLSVSFSLFLQLSFFLVFKGKKFLILIKLHGNFLPLIKVEPFHRTL
jgi:hypothetical protein